MKQMIPVVPACHYMCGGIKVDANGRSSIDYLYACGESTCTGLHGVIAWLQTLYLKQLFCRPHCTGYRTKIAGISIKSDIPEWDATGTAHPKELILITKVSKNLKQSCLTMLGLCVTSVLIALNRLHLLYEEAEDLYNSTTLSAALCELRNLITIGYLVTRSASMRKESRVCITLRTILKKNDFKQSSLL